MNDQLFNLDEQVPKVDSLVVQGSEAEKLKLLSSTDSSDEDKAGDGTSLNDGGSSLADIKDHDSPDLFDNTSGAKFQVKVEEVPINSDAGKNPMDSQETSSNEPSALTDAPDSALPPEIQESSSAEIEGHTRPGVASNTPDAEFQVEVKNLPINPEVGGNPTEPLQTFSNESSAIKEPPESVLSPELPKSVSSDEGNPSTTTLKKNKVGSQQNKPKMGAKASSPKQSSVAGVDMKLGLTLEEILKDIEAQEIQKRQALEAKLEQEKIDRLRMQENQSKIRIEKIEKIGILAYQHGLIDVDMDEFKTIFEKLRDKVTGVLKAKYALRKATALAKTGDKS